MSEPLEPDFAQAARRLAGAEPHWRDAELRDQLDLTLALELWKFRSRPNEWDTWREIQQTIDEALNRTFQGVSPEGIPNVRVRLFEGEPGRYEVTLYDDPRPWVRGIALEFVPNPDGS